MTDKAANTHIPRAIAIEKPKSPSTVERIRKFFCGLTYLFTSSRKRNEEKYSHFNEEKAKLIPSEIIVNADNTAEARLKDEDTSSMPREQCAEQPQILNLDVKEDTKKGLAENKLRNVETKEKLHKEIKDVENCKEKQIDGTFVPGFNLATKYDSKKKDLVKIDDKITTNRRDEDFTQNDKVKKEIKQDGKLTYYFSLRISKNKHVNHKDELKKTNKDSEPSAEKKLGEVKREEKPRKDKKDGEYRKFKSLDEEFADLNLGTKDTKETGKLAIDSKTLDDNTSIPNNLTGKINFYFILEDSELPINNEPLKTNNNNCKENNVYKNKRKLKISKRKRGPVRKRKEKRENNRHQVYDRNRPDEQINHGEHLLNDLQSNVLFRPDSSTNEDVGDMLHEHLNEMLASTLDEISDDNSAVPYVPDLLNYFKDDVAVDDLSILFQEDLSSFSLSTECINQRRLMGERTLSPSSQRSMIDETVNLSPSISDMESDGTNSNLNDHDRLPASAQLNDGVSLEQVNEFDSPFHNIGAEVVVPCDTNTNDDDAVEIDFDGVAGSNSSTETKPTPIYLPPHEMGMEVTTSTSGRDGIDSAPSTSGDFGRIPGENPLIGGLKDEELARIITSVQNLEGDEALQKLEEIIEKASHQQQLSNKEEKDRKDKYLAELHTLFLLISNRILMRNPDLMLQRGDHLLFTARLHNSHQFFTSHIQECMRLARRTS